VFDEGTAVASGNVVTQNVLRDNDLDLAVPTVGTGNVFSGNSCTTSVPPGLFALRMLPSIRRCWDGSVDRAQRCTPSLWSACAASPAPVPTPTNAPQRFRDSPSRVRVSGAAGRCVGSGTGAVAWFWR